jgi:outer membrane protein assembly factor BamB
VNFRFRSLSRPSLVAYVLVFALAVLAPPLAAETWPRFRGPNGSGVGTAQNLPKKWTKDDCLWRVELPGMGFSSPVVWNDRVYVSSGLENDGTQIVQSRDMKSGELVWERRFAADAYKKHRLNSYATSTPALDEDHIYVTWGGPKGSAVVALDRRTGRDRWRYELGPFVSMHNFGASPIVADDLVIVIDDQDKHRRILALGAAKGDVKWNIEEDTPPIPAGADPLFYQYATYATPCLFRPADAACQLIVGRTLSGVQSLDPRSGKPNWKLDLFQFRSVGSPTLDGNRLVAICGSGGGGQRAAVIQPGVPQKKIEPKVLYDIKKDLPYVPTPLIHDGLLYLWADNGKVQCLKLADGKEVWRGRGRGTFYGSPVLADGKLFCVSYQGKVNILAAGHKFQRLGEVDLDENSMSTPAVADGVICFRTFSHLMAIGPKRAH